MIKVLFSLLAASSLSACAVVATTAAIGSAAVSVTSTAVSIGYDVGKAATSGAIAVGGYVYDAANSESASKPDSSANPARPSSTETATVTPLNE
ncbi:hypothetical protein [Chitinibacter sp. S2-10]|uniref:hypothetical protein n=1 Tax=Chitinibacter sp. S2-10 TaxID=3373597 RepID=UPI00397763B2